MKFNLKNRPETLTPEQHKSGNYLWVNPTKAAEWFEGFEKELREKLKEKALIPLELHPQKLIKEILGEAEP